MAAAKNSCCGSQLHYNFNLIETEIVQTWKKPFFLHVSHLPACPANYTNVKPCPNPPYKVLQQCLMSFLQPLLTCRPLYVRQNLEIFLNYSPADLLHSECATKAYICIYVYIHTHTYNVYTY